MLPSVTRRVTFVRRALWVGSREVEDWGARVGVWGVERSRSKNTSQLSTHDSRPFSWVRGAEKTSLLPTLNFQPFLSKLPGKTSKLQIFPSKLRVFPSKLRRNGHKYLLIFRDLKRKENSPWLTAQGLRPMARRRLLLWLGWRLSAPASHAKQKKPLHGGEASSLYII